VNVEIVEDIECLRREWENLWHRLPDASPFQHPAWVLSWAQVYAPGRCLAAALRQHGRIDALIPAFVWEDAMLLAGTGPSDHSSAMFSRDARGAADDMLERLASSFDEPINRIELQQLPPSSPLGSDSKGEACVVLDLKRDRGMTNVPKKMRSNWCYSVRRLEREGGRIELVDPDDAAEAMDGLQRLHSIRWRAEGEEGVLAGDLAERHLCRAIPELARAGLLRMHRLRISGDTIAMLFAMRGARSTCYYLSGFDPDYAKLSPGTALVGSAIAQAAREGCAEFDFLRGQEQYKYRWGAKDRPMFRRLVKAPARASAAAFA
jgi:CelD/BcsL family acetyltransferase involved in cellulose biosynthesis